MSSKITIIGAGSVGSTIAYTLSNQDIASEIVLIDINKEKVAGEVMDIIQGTCFRDPINIKAGEYEDAKDSNIVIITSGIARKPGQTRIELAQTNVNILKDITPKIVKEARRIRLLVPVRSWIQQDFAVDWQSILILHRRTSTLMYLVSMVILLSFRGHVHIFPVQTLMSTLH